MKAGDYMQHIYTGALFQHLGNNEMVQVPINFFGLKPKTKRAYELTQIIWPIDEKDFQYYKPVKLLIIEA